MNIVSNWLTVYLNTLDEAISDFCDFDCNFKRCQMNLKMHAYPIEHHMLEWIVQHYMGCGLMGEQGAESVHHNSTTFY